MDGQKISATAVRLRHARRNKIVRELYRKEVESIAITEKAIVDSLEAIDRQTKKAHRGKR